MAYKSARYTFNFDPLNHARPEDRDYLSELFEIQQISSPFKLVALRRRQFWAVTLPIGVFQNEFREGFADYSANIAARGRMLAQARTDFGIRIPAGRVTIENGGDLFYHQHVIDVFRRVAPDPAFFNALHAFLTLAKAQPALIKGVSKKRPFVPLEKRTRRAVGLARGPAWSTAEDLVLRQWFGRRTYGDQAGKHVALSDAEWQGVLDRLDQRRSKGSVRARLVVLNHQLKRELTVDGYIPRARYEEYYSRVLGENPRAPRVAPPRRRRA